MAKLIDDIVIQTNTGVDNVSTNTSSYQIRTYSSGAGTQYVLGNPDVRTSSINFGKTPNYDKQYQLIQTSGRTNFNKNFVHNNGVYATQTASVSGSSVFKDDAIQDRVVQKTTFVEKFSAPGGPETNAEITQNRESGEYSPYNTVNYRNSLVRRSLDEFSAESSSIDPNFPSYHKINKNPKHKVSPENSIPELNFEDFNTFNLFFDDSKYIEETSTCCQV